MLRPLRLTIGAILGLVLVPGAAFAADALVLRQRIGAGYADVPGREQMQYFTPNLRVTDDERARSIVDLDEKTFVFINKRKQTYMVLTFDEMEQRPDRHDDRVEGLPPKVRELIRVREKVSATPTGKTTTIAGHTAKEYKVESYKVSGKVWIASDLDLGGRAKDWAHVAQLLGGTTSPGGQLDETLATLGGVPLRRELRIDPLPPTVTEVLEIRRAEIPAELKQIPDGYTKVTPAPVPTRTPIRNTRTPKPKGTPRAKTKSPAK